VYRAVQDGDNRPPKAKTLAVFQFVTHHTASDGSRPSWNELLRLWNEKCHDYPAYRFTQRDGLYRAYKRAEQELAAPWLDVPKNLRAKEEPDTNEFGILDIPF
jgi:hypothetical protein